jgi:branched-chain amino acid aminotransferase
MQFDTLLYRLFIVRRGEIWTSAGMSVSPESPAQTCCVFHAVLKSRPLRKTSLVDVYGADEAFVTGTFAGLTPVLEVDGRILGHPTKPAEAHPDGGAAGPMTRRLQALYKELIELETVRP